MSLLCGDLFHRWNRKMGTGSSTHDDRRSKATARTSPRPCSPRIRIQSWLAPAMPSRKRKEVCRRYQFSRGTLFSISCGRREQTLREPFLPAQFDDAPNKRRSYDELARNRSRVIGDLGLEAAKLARIGVSAPVRANFRKIVSKSVE